MTVGWVDMCDCRVYVDVYDCRVCVDVCDYRVCCIFFHIPLVLLHIQTSMRQRFKLLASAHCLNDHGIDVDTRKGS